MVHLEEKTEATFKRAAKAGALDAGEVFVKAPAKKQGSRAANKAGAQEGGTPGGREGGAGVAQTPHQGQAKVGAALGKEFLASLSSF